MTTSYKTCKNIFALVPTVAKDENDNESVYVSVAYGETYHLDDKTNLIPDKENIRICYQYPLSIPCVKTFQTPTNGFTQKQLVLLVQRGYREIYDEENTSSSIAEQPMSQAYPGCGLINRCETNGVHGIWGHSIGDLYLHTLTYDNSADVFHVGVDS